MQDNDKSVAGYSPVAKALHWLTAALVLVAIPVAIVMVQRGPVANIWDQTTDDLYSLHKLLGFTILMVVVVRLGYRLVHGAPPPEPGLEPLQKLVSGVVHWTMYGVLIVAGLLGWIATAAYPALGVFGLFNLPAIISPNQELAGQLYALHRPLGLFMLLLIGMHVGASLFHHFIRKDNVLRRMLP